ncbi:SUMF1/EgtB/PvdO family nonheme iron enzyme [Capnocytophaga sp.]|uniref:SUMF1/EgtB/PvdO family nonheme iron enzyme n=1 Tax=Capnocytophaga sp. TaxID=44737 RepID=UPI0026DC0BDA|nr:SUMF1/EgtB/PvdO family nonheme iron enzyme [Capnocytophaga sp.]MDO5104772.1 SUMF1/EgtB/PvdO family nonheme iron enzyme [Capnocytophaga sp.]
MKKFFIYAITALFVVVAANCSKKDIAEDVVYDTLKVSSTEVVLRADKEASFGIESGSGEYQVQSADTSIATVILSGKNVLVTGVQEGETTILVTDKKSGQKHSVKVKVSAGLVELVVDIDDEMSLLSGAQTEIGIQGNGNYQVESVDPTVVKATLSGTTILVLEALSAGTTTITVVDTESEEKIEFPVVVTEKQLIELNIEEDELVVKAYTDIEREQAAVKKEKLESTKIEIVSGAGNYTVTSSDENIAKVRVEGNEIYIDGYKTGTVTITIANDVDEPKEIVAHVYALNLEVSNISLKPYESVAVQVIDGSGEYGVEGVPAGVEVTVSGSTITITGTSPVKTEITIKDKVSGKEVILGVYVLEGAVSPEDADTVLVEGGTFRMGSDDGDPDERVRHNVTLSSYRISKYEITNAQYAKFLNAVGNKIENGLLYYNGIGKEREKGIVKNGNTFEPVKGRENYPVTYVSWYGAKAYAEWVGGSLPTEAQWEFASLGGTKSQKYKFSGSNNVNEVGYHLGNSKGLNPVGTLKANELGIHDMSGNAWEWTADEYYSNYTSADKVDPQPYKTDNAKKRFVRRGASVYCKPNYCRSANRGANDSFQNNISFRVVFPVN